MKWLVLGSVVPLVLLPLVGCGSDDSSYPSTDSLGTASAAIVTESCGQPMSGPVQGYDISEHQGSNFDWNGAKTKDGISFGYARISYGTDHPDLTFDTNWQRIKAAGLLRGAYQYFIPVEDVAAQAQMVVDKLGKLGEGDLPVQFDVEPVGWERGSLTGKQIADKMKQWLAIVEAGTGKKPFIYTNAYLWQDSINSDEFGDYGLWIANYLPPSGCPKINTGWTRWTIWQYSDGNGKLDHNVFNGTLADLQAYAAAGDVDVSEEYPLIVRRSATDIDGDGMADTCARAIRGVVCALSTGNSFRPAFEGPALSDDAGWLNPAYADTIVFGDIDGDGKADVCARQAEGVFCKRSDGASFSIDVKGPAWSDEQGWSQRPHYGTMQLADVNGDGKLDVCGRNQNGITCAISDGNGFPTEIAGPAWSDGAGWSRADQYATIQFADVDGDGKADVCGRDSNGVICNLSNGTAFPTEVRGPAWSNASGWSKTMYGSTIRFPDVNGDGRADVCGRGPNGMTCALWNGSGFGAELAGPAWLDTDGWNRPESFRTIQWGDINGDHLADVCGRGPTGMVCHLSQGDRFGDAIMVSSLGDSGTQYSATIALGDINHDGKDDICHRGKDGVVCVPSTGAGFGDPIAGAHWSDDTGWANAPYSTSFRVVGSAPMAKYVPPPPTTTSPPDAGETPPRGAAEASAADSGCACALGSNAPTRAPYAALLLGLALLRRRRAAR